MNQHESSDASVRSLAKFGGGILILVLITLVAMGTLFRYLATRPQPLPAPLALTRELPPPPRLQVRPRSDLQSLRAAEDAILSSYAWVDRGAGIVRIPIERAMDLVVEREPAARAPAQEQRKR